MPLGKRDQSVDDSIDDGHLQLVGQHEREQRRARRGAHRSEIAEIDRERPMPDRVRRHEPPIEMNAFNLCVGGQHVERAALRLESTAASSPGPTRTQDGVARRAVMRAMSACSPMSETVRLLTAHRTRTVGA